MAPKGSPRMLYAASILASSDGKIPVKVALSRAGFSAEEIAKEKKQRQARRRRDFLLKKRAMTKIKGRRTMSTLPRSLPSNHPTEVYKKSASNNHSTNHNEQYETTSSQPFPCHVSKNRYQPNESKLTCPASYNRAINANHEYETSTFPQTIESFNAYNNEQHHDPMLPQPFSWNTMNIQQFYESTNELFNISNFDDAIDCPQPAIQDTSRLDALILACSMQKPISETASKAPAMIDTSSSSEDSTFVPPSNTMYESKNAKI